MATPFLHESSVRNLDMESPEFYTQVDGLVTQDVLGQWVRWEVRSLPDGEKELVAIPTWAPVQQGVPPVPLEDFRVKTRKITKIIYTPRHHKSELCRRFERHQRRRQRQIEKRELVSQNIPRQSYFQRNSVAIGLRKTILKCPERDFKKFYNDENILLDIFVNQGHLTRSEAERYVRAVYRHRRNRKAPVRSSMKHYASYNPFLALKEEKLVSEPSQWVWKAHKDHRKRVAKPKTVKERKHPKVQALNRCQEIPVIRDYLLSCLRMKLWKLRPRYNIVVIKPKIKQEKFDLPHDIVWMEPTEEELDFLRGNPGGTFHQMDAAHGDESLGECVKASNVVIESQREASVAETCKDHLERFQRLAVGDQIATYPNLADRWIQVDTFSWTNAGSATQLKKLHFPAFFLKQRGKVPNALPFSVHHYWSGDMEIKIQVNSNKFMCGQLQCSWLYDTLADERIDLRENMYTLSQTEHCLVNAGSSSPGTLYVHYQNPRPFLPTTTRADSINCLNLGTLYIYILSQLKTPSTVRASCDVSIFVRFPNSRFAGLKSTDIGSFVYPQMEAAGTIMAVTAAEKVLASVTTDSQRDNPPGQGARRPMVPQAMQSVALGDELPEPINTLRLSATGQTPAIKTDCDEMSIDFVTRRFGLIVGFSWNASMRSGTLLNVYDASPVPNIKDLQYWSKDSNFLYAVPPVGVISSCFEYWRGSLEMRVDLIATQFHTGRLLVAYAPRYLGEITFEQAMGCYNMIFDLQEKQSFTFIVPYITNYVVWPRKVGYTDTTDKFKSPGRVHIFVLNELTLIENVTDSISCLVYWRAGPDFSVYVPAQPSTGTGFWTTSDTPSNQTKALPSYFPWYVGYDANLEDGKKAVLRYGPLDTHLAQFQNMKEKTYYTVNKDFEKYTISYYNEKNELVTAKFFVPVNLDDGYGAVYMGVVADQATAIKYVEAPNRDLLVNVYKSDAAPYTPDGVNIVFDGTAIQKNPNGSRTLVRYRFDGVPEHEVLPQTGEADYAQPGCSTAPAPVVESGMGIFGEQFTHLKPLCRRYQPYALASFNSNPTPGNASFQFPAIPQGLDLSIADQEKKSNFYTKCIRDGVIPVILSGYRFYRGGLRFKLLPPSLIPQNYWIQHKPSYVTESKVTYPKNYKIASNLLSTGYASYMQSTHVNNVGEFEVPFYKPGIYTYLQRPNLKATDIAQFAHLGTIAVGLDQQCKESIYASFKQQCLINYSLADDAQAVTFQGFPPMIFLDTIYKVKGDLNIENYARNTAQFQSPVHHQMGIEVHHKVDFDDDKINSIVEHLLEATGGAAADFVSQIGHVLINPTFTTTIWALFSILFKMGIISGKYMHKLIENFNVLGAAIGPSFMGLFDGKQRASKIELRLCTHGDHCMYRRNGPDDKAWCEQFVPQSFDSEEYYPLIAQIASLCWSAVSVVAGVTAKAPASFTELLRSSIFQMNQQVRSSHYAFMFISNHLSFFKKIAEYLSLYNNQAELLKTLKEDDYPMYSFWVDECVEILDVKNENMIYSRDAAWAERVEHAYAVGQHIVKVFSMSSSRDPGMSKAFTHVRDVLARLRLKREQMYKRGFSAISRREPFCVYLCGDAGIGKSQMIPNLAINMAKSEHIGFTGELIYNLQSGSTWWDGCKEQPFIVIDDFLCVNSSPMKENSLQELFKLKSPTILNPPMAALEEKELRYAPEGLFMTSNEAFPKAVGVHEPAVYRRRDLLVHVKLAHAIRCSGIDKITTDPELFKQTCADKGLDPTKFEHLLFEIANDPSDPGTQYSKEYTYVEFKEILLRQFSIYRTNQLRLYDQKKEMYDDLVIRDDYPGLLKEKSEQYKRMVRLMINTYPQEGVSISSFFKTIKLLSEAGYSEGLQAEKVLRPITEATLQQITNIAIGAEPQIGDCAHPEPKQCIDYTLPNLEIVSKTMLKNNMLFLYRNNKYVSDFKLGGVECTSMGVVLWDFLSNLAASCEADLFFKFITTLKIGNILKSSKETTDKMFYINDKVHKYEQSRNFLEHFFLLIKLLYPNQNKWQALPCCDLPNYNNCKHLYADYHQLLYRWNEETKRGEYYSMDDDEYVFDSDKNCCSHCICAENKHNFRLFALSLQNKNKHIFDFVPEEEKPLCLRQTFCRSLHALLTTKQAWKDSYVNWKQSGSNFYSNYMLPCFKKFWELTKKIAPILAVIGLAVGASALIKKYTGVNADLGYTYNDVNINTPIQPQNTYVKDKPVRVKTASGAKPALKVFKINHQSLNVECEKIQNIERIIQNNTYHLTGYHVPLGATFNPALHKIGVTARFTFIGGQYGIIVKHWLETMKSRQCTHITFSGIKTTQARLIEFKNLIENSQEKSSISLVRVVTFPHHQSLYKNFSPLNDHSKPRGQGVIVEPTPRGINKIVVEVGDIESVNVSANEEMGIAAQQLDFVYSYGWSQAGYCGAFLLNPNLNRPIIGYHVAGAISVGMSEPLIQENFAEVAALMRPLTDDSEIMAKTLDVPDRMDGMYVPIGCVVPPLAKHQSGESCIVPSMIQGVFPITTEPAPLKIGDPRVPIPDYSPLYAGVSNMLDPPLNFNSEHLDKAAEDLENLILTKCQPVIRPCKPREYSEVITGIPGYDFFDGINMKTSEGFPLSRYRPGTADNKEWLFTFKQHDSYRECTSIHTSLAAILHDKREQRLRNEIPFTVFDDCLKDARVPINKAATPGKTRVFSACPVDYVIEFKRYFVDFLAAYKTQNFNVEHAIGINPDSIQWTLLSKHLHSIESPWFVTGDYSNFGPTLAPNVVAKVNKIIVKWVIKYMEHLDVPQSYLEILLLESSEAVHLVNAFLYQVFAGSPSGAPHTVEMNSMVNSLYIRCAWLEIMKNYLTRPGLEEFHLLTRRITYGDDLIMSVSREVIKQFNNETLSKFFKDHNIKFTDANKNSNIPYVQHIGETTFLKRGFKHHPQWHLVLLAPLDLATSVQDCANWVHKKDDLKDATRQAAEDALTNSYGHGPCKYAAIKERLSSALQYAEIFWTPRSWEDWDKIHFPMFYYDKDLIEDQNLDWAVEEWFKIQELKRARELELAAPSQEAQSVNLTDSPFVFDSDERLEQI